MLNSRKRRSSDSQQPPITKFFATVKRERSQSEKLKGITVPEPQSSGPSQDIDEPEEPLYSGEELRNLLGIPLNPSWNELPEPDKPAALDNLPKRAYSHILTILDLNSINALSLTSKSLASRVKCYVAGHEFYRRLHLDQLDFMDSSIRPDDDEFAEHDPFIACGALIKSITITLDTKIRAHVFLNICRNLRIHLGGGLHGFGRLLETMTHSWRFSERRVMVKAAILIDSELRKSMIKVLTSAPGEFADLEIKVRSGLTELFLNRNQEVEEAAPSEIIEFGSWLSVLIRNVVDKYQGRLYYILFGPTKSSQCGERIDWVYFAEEPESRTLRKSMANYKKILMTLLNGLRALRIMTNSKNTDGAWSDKKIYQLFLRVVETCDEQGGWSETASSMSLAIDTSGLFSEYLVSCLDPHRTDYCRLCSEAAEMVCLVRNHLYRWCSAPATYLAEPLHHAFNHLARVDGQYVSAGHYKNFLSKLWETHKDRVSQLVAIARNTPTWSHSIREELDGQLSITRLLTDFSDAVPLQEARLAAIREPVEQDEQLLI